MSFEYNTDKIRGVLNLSRSEKNYRLARIKPSGPLDYYVEQYWIVRWDLPGGKHHTQQNIPQPCAHVVVEKEKSRIVGPVTRKYSSRMQDSGMIFGIKFRPGGFYPLNNGPVSNITDKSPPLEVTLEDSEALVSQILAATEDEQMVMIAEKFLGKRLPDVRDENIGKVCGIIEAIERDRGIVKVDDLVTAFNTSTRTLQRLFNTYVGVSPKWVIKKYRLYEVLDAFEKGETDVQDLIEQLGYFDQSHFIKDFKNFTGKSPQSYLARQ